MALNPPIPQDLLIKWSKRMAEDLEKRCNAEHRPDELTWTVAPCDSYSSYDPPSQVTDKIYMDFTFRARYKGKPSGSDTPPDSADKYSIGKISHRVIKKMKK